MKITITSNSEIIAIRIKTLTVIGNKPIMHY